MKKLALTIVLLSFFLYLLPANEFTHTYPCRTPVTFSFAPLINLSHANSDEISEDEIIDGKENIILKDIKWDWFQYKYRLEKVFIALGTLLAIIGAPFLLVGLLQRFLPTNAATPTFYKYTYAFMGIGGGIMGTGPVFIITGSVRLSIRKKKDKNTSQDATSDNSTGQD